MNPWTILGWALVVILTTVCAAVVFVIAVSVWAYAKPRVRALALHYRTRKTAPAKGQVWAQGASTLEITFVRDDGRVGIRRGAASWSDSAEQWSRRVANRRLWLMREPKP